MVTRSRPLVSLTSRSMDGGVLMTPCCARRWTSAMTASRREVASSGTTMLAAVRSSRNCMRGHPDRRRRSERLPDEVDDLDRTAGDSHAVLLEGADLLGGGARRAADDRAGVAHAAPGRSGLPGDEADDRLGQPLADERRRVLLVRAADLSDHDHRLGLSILLERGQAVDERRPDDRVAADAHARRLAEAGARELVDDLVRERSRAGHDADRAARHDLAGDDPDLRAARRDEAGAVRPDQARAPLLDERIHPRHVEDRDALRDRHDELDPGVRGLEDRVGRERGRDVDDGGVGAGLGNGAVHGIEDRHARAVRPLERLSALARRDARDDRGPVLDHLPCVERAVAARDPLHDQPCAFVSKDRHDQPLTQAARPASSTARWTTSSIDVDALKPAPWRISRASCSFVPVNRITIGTRISIRRLASTIPLATSSHRVMPPKMLNRMTLTFGSWVMIRSALTTLSGLDEPPMSKKFAGSPP